MKPGTDQWTHHRFAHVKTVTLYVGKDKVDFQVHEDTLFDASPLFRKAFKSDSEEDSERILDFSEDDPGLFGHLVECIYSKSFSMDMFEDATSNTEREIQAAQLFALAEKYGVETVMLNIGLKLHAHGEKRRQMKHYNHVRIPPERRAVEIAYQYTHRDSILRKVFVDWCSACSVGEIRDLRDWLPTVPEFASDLVVTTSREKRYFYMDQKDYLLRLTGGKGYEVL